MNLADDSGQTFDASNGNSMWVLLLTQGRMGHRGLALALKHGGQRSLPYSTRMGLSDTVVQPCIWFKKEPSRDLHAGPNSTESNLFAFNHIHTGLDECPRILLPCFRARNSDAGTEQRHHRFPSFLPFSRYIAAITNDNSESEHPDERSIIRPERAKNEEDD